MGARRLTRPPARPGTRPRASGHAAGRPVLLILLFLSLVAAPALAQDAAEAPPPEAGFSLSPRRPEPGQSVFASAARESEAFGACAPLTNFAWDWDGDGVFEVNGTSSTSRHTFDDVGAFPVTLVVTDACGQTAAATETITVEVPRTGLDFSILWEYREAYLNAALLTLYISVVSILAGLPLGILMGLARMSPIGPLRWVAMAYIEFIRGTPLLVQIFIVIFALPEFGLRFDALTGAIIALVINTSAYQAEIVRSGIQAIPSGQMEAALGMGMTGRQSMRFVILPQALRLVIPPLTNEFVILIKDSSLVSVIGVFELMLVARTIGVQTFQIFEALAGAALMYFVLTYSLSTGLRALERKLAIPGLGIQAGGGHERVP